VIEGVPFAHRETTTFVGALRVTSFTTPVTIDVLTVDGPINGCIFLAWVRQHLVPNAGFRRHRRDGLPVESQSERCSESDRISGPRSPLSATILAQFESDQPCIPETQEAAP